MGETPASKRRKFIMAQSITAVQTLRNNHNCESKEGDCGKSANSSAARKSNARDVKRSDSYRVSSKRPDFSLGRRGAPEIGILLNPISPKIADRPYPSEIASKNSVPQYIRDIDSLKESKLKQAYPKEHTSWRNRRDYAKKTGIPFYPPWNSFPVFLRELGPIPADGYTLDKINPEGGYTPGNVRWASKETQTHNRRNTVWLIHEGQKLPLAVWASRTNQAESTLRWRHDQNWPHENIITGISPAKNRPLPFGHPWPIRYAQQWEGYFQRDAAGRIDRIDYLILQTSKHLKSLSERADSFCYPADYSPTKEEEMALEKFNREYDLWSGFWRHAQGLRAR